MKLLKTIRKIIQEAEEQYNIVCEKMPVWMRLIELKNITESL